MPSLSFLPPPDGLGPEQRQRWALRLRTAEDALAGLTAGGTAAAGHLHDYVNGRITLGQALGRVVDHRARAAGPRP